MVQKLDLREIIFTLRFIIVRSMYVAHRNIRFLLLHMATVNGSYKQDNWNYSWMAAYCNVILGLLVAGYCLLLALRHHFSYAIARCFHSFHTV